LYRLFKDGDEQAFEMLYRTYNREIFNYALKVLGNRDLAEDVLEETFIKLFQSNLRESGKLKNWLYRVATNLSYKCMRRRRRELTGSEAYLERAPGERHDERILARIHIQRKLMKIPEKQRMVIVLKFYQGLKYSEIADVLGCPLGTVKTRMHDGLKRLRRAFEKDPA
jgi:RNA polymerase sigma-70 factor (ECF subfamily)